MTKSFRKLMRDQLKAQISALPEIKRPKAGWIRSMRDALGMSSRSLAKRLGCSQANISLIEQRESKGSITLETLDQIARAMNCKLVYALVPIDSLEQTLEDQARLVAQRHMRAINHTMKLEQQELTPIQLKQQEDSLVEELLDGNLRQLWESDEV